MRIEGSGGAAVSASGSGVYLSPETTARTLIAQNTSRAGIDYDGLRQDLAQQGQLQPFVGQRVMANLSPVQQGQFLRAQDRATPLAVEYAAPGPSAAPASSDGPSTATLVADLTQMTLDLTGIVEPTPFSDGANTGISVVRSLGSLFSGNFSDAGGHFVNGVLSAAGMIPYLGDLAKAGKFGRWASTVSDTISAISRNPALAGRLEPLLREASNLLDKIPQGVLDSLPSGARESIERMKTQIDEFFSGAAQTFNRGIEATAERLGIDPARLQNIIETPKGQRPAPSTYMSAEQIADHFARFDDGAIRFTSQANIDRFGGLGPDDGFVMPASEFNDLVARTNGNLPTIERELGLNPGQLSDGDTVIAFIERGDLNGLQVPSGNERGANEQWLPGGQTSGGVSEAVTDLTGSVPYATVEIGS